MRLVCLPCVCPLLLQHRSYPLVFLRAVWGWRSPWGGRRRGATSRWRGARHSCLLLDGPWLGTGVVRRVALVLPDAKNVSAPTCFPPYPCRAASPEEKPRCSKKWCWHVLSRQQPLCFSQSVVKTLSVELYGQTCSYCINLKVVRVLNLSKLGHNLDNFFFFEKRFV